MEFTKIISSPVFAASAPDIGLEAQSASPVKIEVTTSSASWSITLSPVSDASGKNLLNIRLRDILSAAVTAPDTSETEPNSAIPIPVVSLSASNDDGEQASMDIPVAYGSLNGKDPADFIGHWLTSREQICRTYSWARERLSLIFGPQLLRLPGPVSLSINCRAYFASGTARNFHLVSATSENTVYYSIDCSYSAISALDDSGEQLVAWDLSYTLSGLHADGERVAVESFPQRFILANQDERIREYVFANCFGMEDRVFGEGIAKREVSGSSSTFINGGKTLEVSNNAEIVYTAFSGQLSDRRAVFHWYDFLSSDNRKLFDARDSSMTRIVVDGHDSKTDDFNVSGVNFSYRLSEKRTGYPGNLFGSIGDYDPKQQFGALWVDDDPQAITPEEKDLFFLKHRLSEFQTLTASDALLLLVQTPATDAWGSISLGSIKSWIKKFLDGESRAIRLNSLADYETADGKAINPSDLPDGSIPVWNAAAGAYRPTPVSELGPSGEDLHSLIFKKGDQAVLTYTPNKSDAVFDISDFASGKTVSDHISNESVHVTTEEKSLWNSLSALFELVNIGTEENPVPVIRAKYGLFSDSFISVRGSDPEAGGGSGGLDISAMWDALAAGTSEKINASHIPALDISKITGLQDALDAKLEGITKGMVEAVLTGTVTSHNHDGRYAPLSGGLIPSQYLPSYVDDVLEYASMTAFPATGEAGKIYVALDTNLTYRWGGSAYVEISPSLALGYTSSTAYPGDEGAALAALVEGMKEITDLFGIDEGGNVYVKDGRGFYSKGFVSARGSDPLAGSSGAGGLDEEALWTILGRNTSEQINVSHIPELSISKITGLQFALNAKLEGITSQMVVAALGYTPYDAAAISAASVAYASSSGTAGKVAQKLTVKNDGGSSSASAKTFDGSAAVTVTIPTTLPASDVYAWAKAATKPSYTWGEIGGKPSVFTPAAHKHPLSEISDLHASWDALLKSAPAAFVTRWPAWGEVTGKPSAFTPAAHKHVKADITDFPTSWAWSAITGKPTTLAGYGITDGVNGAKATGGLSAAVDGHVLSIGVASGYAVPTSAQINAWNLVASLFGVDSDGNVYVKGGKGFYGTSFVSARGSDPLAGSSGAGGLDEEAMWDALAAGTSEQINVSHIPELNISKITGLQSALDGKLNNGSTTYDTAYARNLTINGITYGIWATANPAALGPFYIPTSAGTSGYILQSTGGVPGWISRAALTQQLFSGGKGCVAIPENSDLNDYTTPGLYYCPANATVQTLANVPVTGAFSLEILQAAGVIQILREYGYSSNANEYTRRYYNGSWTTWVRAPRLNELYTKTEADGRYLKLAGGTMTGNLYARDLIVPGGYYLYGVKESGGAMVGFANGRTQLGSIGASTTAATHIRSITGHITAGSSDAATYHVLDTGNYTSYTVTKTGGGASGTWGISVSGNAATATNASQLGGVGASKYMYHSRQTGVNIDTISTLYPRIIEVTSPAGTGPVSNAWYQVMQWGSVDAGYGFQTANLYNVTGSMFFRQKIAGTWSGWKTILDSANYTSYAVSLTGAQTVSGAKTFSSPVTAPALTYSRKYITRCNSVGWYRCFSFSSNNASCPTAILHVSRIYNTPDGESYVFAISLGYNGKVSITQLSGTAGERIITKIRVAYVNLSTAYVDFYYSPSYSRVNEVYVSSSGYGISQTPEQVNDTTSSFYEFETSDGCKSDTYVTAGQYVYSPKGLFGLTEAQANSYAGSGYYKLAVGQQSPSKGASLLLYRDSTSYQSYIGWSTGSADHVVIGLANGTNDLGITNKKGAIKLTGQGTLTYNNYTVWHAGNDGSGSGLDADLLDGTQKSGLLTSAASTPATNLSVTVGGTTKSVAGLYATYLGGFPATAFDLSTNLGTCQDYGCYVIGLMQITDYTTAGNHANGELILIRQNGNNPAQKIIYSLSTRYNTTDVRFGHLVVGYYSKYATPCTFTHNGKKWAGFNVTTASAYYAGIVCKRDGVRLGERSTPFLLKYRDSNTGQILNSEVNDSLVVDGSDIIESGVSARSFIGALSGNATSATKLATARSLWGQSFNGTGNVSGDMTGVGDISMSGGINSRVYVGSGDDLSRIGFKSHYVEFKGHGYFNMGYYFRPGYSSSGETRAAVYIQNASASGSPVFTTTHAFGANGDATHSGSLSAGSTITSGAHLFMKAVHGRFVFNAAGSGFMMSMESGNFRLMSHNNASYVARLVEVDMSGNVGIKAAPASGYALTVAGAGYFGGALSLPLPGSVGLLVDNNLRNLSWTVDTSGGWARSLKATDPTGSTTLINAVGVYGAGQTPKYVYLGGTSYSSPSMAITAAGNVGIGTTSPGYRLDVRGTGYFSGVLGANGMTLPYGGTSWISMASTPAVLKGAMNQSSSSAHPLFRVKNSGGDAIVFGGLGSNTGFYGFTAERISSGANSYDWYTTWNVGTGRLTHNGAMTVGGLLTASAGLTTPQYVQVGAARLKWDASANALYVEKSDGTACGFYAKGFVSSRGSDPLADGAGGGWLDEETLWDILGTSGTEKIDESHLPTATASTPGVVKGGYAYKVPGSQTSVNLPVTITASGQMYVSVPASAIKTILMNLG